MKKIFGGFLALSAVLFTACDSKNEEYFGSLQDANKVPISELILYADEPTGQFYVVSSETWTATTTASWATISPTSTDKPYMATPIKVTTNSANDTGKIRTGLVKIALGRNELGLTLYHLPWHNITTPVLNSSRKFETQLISADSIDMPVAFTVYTNGATLTSSDAWVYAPSTTFAAGTHNITVPVGKNSGAARTATLTLTAGGVSTPITVKQPAKAN